MFEIYYEGNNPELIDAFPFAKQFSKTRIPNTKMWWYVPVHCEITDYDIFNFRPAAYDAIYTHEWGLMNVAGKGGLKLIPTTNPDASTKCMEEKVCIETYDVIEKDDGILLPVAEYFKLNESAKYVWHIDPEYVITNKLEWAPGRDEPPFAHIFKLSGQLEHKYNPSEQHGGLVLYPRPKTTLSEIPYKFQGVLADVSEVTFERFDSFTQGTEQSTHPWFWVVDPDVEVLPDFDFNFVPDPWDTVPHVWQKLNPVTGKVYDYGGVYLYPKGDFPTRPKYFKQPSCTQREFPVYQLAPGPILEQLTEFDKDSNCHMFWVIEPGEKKEEFDFYPTQWDVRSAHVELNIDARIIATLYPKGISDNPYCEFELFNHAHYKAKDIRPAVMKTVWPAVETSSYDIDHIQSILHKHKDVPFVWIYDADVDVNESIIHHGFFVPNIFDYKKIHVWQRLNPSTNAVHSFGGLRLFPTDYDLTPCSPTSLSANQLSQVVFKKDPGCTYKPYDIAFLSYKEPNATEQYKKLMDQSGIHNLIWISDVTGIMAAHKEAAEQADSKMFWVVDADAVLEEDFTFDYIPSVYDQNIVHIWSSKNPATGDIYGYGGVKLFNREQILKLNTWGLDFSTGVSKDLRVMPNIACTTTFNTDPISSWRSAFRESVKLFIKGDEESLSRLQKWLSPNTTAAFADEVKRGAEDGRSYALENFDDDLALAKINDWEWLRDRYGN